MDREFDEDSPSRSQKSDITRIFESCAVFRETGYDGTIIYAYPQYLSRACNIFKKEVYIIV